METALRSDKEGVQVIQMGTRLKHAPQIWALAVDLGLKPRDNALKEIVRLCLKRIRGFLAEFPCNTLTELTEVAAAKLDSRFIQIRSDQELQRVRDLFLSQGEIEFADLDHQLGPDVYAITFRLIHPKKHDRHFVSLIDCRGKKAWRCYFSKWHELAHLLTLTPQMRLKFCRTHCIADQKDPEEAAMDVIAGAVGFLPDLVQRHASGSVSFEKVQELRARICPEASFQASLIGLVQSWPTPALLVQPALALRKHERVGASQYSFGFKEKPEPVLRAVSVTPNESARELGLDIFRNMRVPKKSVIYRVFSGEADFLETVENLGWWEASDGTHLQSRQVLVQAKRIGTEVHALLTLPV